jgi:hypothetical protein
MPYSLVTKFVLFDEHTHTQKMFDISCVEPK